MSKLVKYFSVLIVFVLAGCREVMTKPNSDLLIAEKFASVESINNYLETNLASTGFNGKAYCAYQVLDGQLNNSPQKIYLWVLCQEYYQEEGILKQGTGSSFPIALEIMANNDQLEVINHHQPRDGSLYSKDIAVIFPTNVQKIITSQQTIYYVEKLSAQVKSKANQYLIK